MLSIVPCKFMRGLDLGSAARTPWLRHLKQVQTGSRGLGVHDPDHAAHERSRPAVMTAAVCSAGCSPHQLHWKPRPLIFRIGRLDAAASLSEPFPDGQQRACCARPCDALHEGEASRCHDCCSMPCRQLSSVEARLSLGPSNSGSAERMQQLGHVCDCTLAAER